MLKSFKQTSCKQSILDTNKNGLEKTFQEDSMKWAVQQNELQQTNKIGKMRVKMFFEVIFLNYLLDINGQVISFGPNCRINHKPEMTQLSSIRSPSEKRCSNCAFSLKGLGNSLADKQILRK